jgi:hypothetical protein
MVYVLVIYSSSKWQRNLFWDHGWLLQQVRRMCTEELGRYYASATIRHSACAASLRRQFQYPQSACSALLAIHIPVVWTFLHRSYKRKQGWIMQFIHELHEWKVLSLNPFEIFISLSKTVRIWCTILNRVIYIKNKCIPILQYNAIRRN